MMTAGDRRHQTTIRVQRALWIPFRQKCIAREVSASEQVDTLIAEQLARWEEEDAGRGRRGDAGRRR